MDTPFWERQPWDTNASHQAFKECYLPESEPGRLIKAYRKYWQTRRETGAKQAWEKKREGRGAKEREPTAVPGSWSNWSRGGDSAGKRIPAVYTWAQRAAAFDAHIAHLELQKLANNLRIEYGDLPQQRMEISGTPLVAAPERPSYSHLTDEEILERLAQLDAKRTGRVPDSE